MKIKTKLDRKALRTHFSYHWWKYLAVIAASVFGWNLLYTTTAYRPPEDKRVDLYIQTVSVSEQAAAQFIQPLWEQAVPDMEYVGAILLTSSSQDYYGNMQLTVYIMAGEGDIYMLASSDFKSYAAQGVFLDLQPFIDEGSLNVDGLDLSAGYVALTNENGLPAGERHLYGIPAYELNGYMEGMGLDSRNLVLGVTAFNGNEENVIRFLNSFIQAGRAAHPEGLKE